MVLLWSLVQFFHSLLEVALGLLPDDWEEEAHSSLEKAHVRTLNFVDDVVHQIDQLVVSAHVDDLLLLVHEQVHYETGMLIVVHSQHTHCFLQILLVF